MNLFTANYVAYSSAILHSMLNRKLYKFVKYEYVCIKSQDFLREVCFIQQNAKKYYDFFYRYAKKQYALL